MFKNLANFASICHCFRLLNPVGLEWSQLDPFFHLSLFKSFVRFFFNASTYRTLCTLSNEWSQFRVLPKNQKLENFVPPKVLLWVSKG